MRADAPPAVWLGPECPMCEESLGHDLDTGLFCTFCGARWTYDGRFIEWFDNEAEQCAVCKRGQQCLLEDNHPGSHKSHSFDWVEV